MLTVMCPNCRHRFPAAGCCEPATTTTSGSSREEAGFGVVHQEAVYGGHHVPHHRRDSFYGGLLVARGYAGDSGCLVNAPTIVQGPAIIQGGGGQRCCSLTSSSTGLSRRTKPREELVSLESNVGYRCGPGECHITTTCDLTGGSVTITTPGIQSGGFLIQSTDSGLQVQPHIEIRPRLSGGGVLVQKRLTADDEEAVLPDDSCRCAARRSHGSIPSGCQELPGIRRSSPSKPKDEEEECVESRRGTRHGVLELPPRGQQCRSCHEHRPSSSRSFDSPTCSENLRDGDSRSNGVPGNEDSPRWQQGDVDSPTDGGGQGLQIQVNATVQLPANLGQCTLNITASAANGGGASLAASAPPKNRNNFNGGGLVRQDSRLNVSAGNVNSNERRDGAPGTPVSWLMPCPWGFDSCLADESRLREVRRLLQSCGWYHEGLSWQQSESLLKSASVGRWLMRDSSDSRYTFAVSVQTTRGPTSVRVHYFLGQFRLDAEPRLALAMPAFDCPIKMLEYYVDYSKRIDEKEQVWVDYSGQVYSQIYLTNPLLKEVRSLSHLARLAINRNSLPTDHLPPIIRNYLAEYPYTL